MPADVAAFSELHDHVDANRYLLDVAGMARSGPAVDQVHAIGAQIHSDTAPLRVAIDDVSW